MIRRIKGVSILARLTRVYLLVTGMALLLAALAFFSYDLTLFRGDLVHMLLAQAQITGDNSVSALLFDDAQAAASTLLALRNSPDVQMARILTNNGQPFAEYTRARQAVAWEVPALAPGRPQQTWTHGATVLVAWRIFSGGKPVGVVAIQARLGEVARRARLYLAISALILVFCMLASLPLAAAVSRAVAEPIVGLASTARSVSRDRDYSVRAVHGNDPDEIVWLVEAFNEMLARMQQHETALQSAHDELELRVEQRTAELQAANRELEAFSYTVAHDLRGPLDLIGGNAYLLQHAYDQQIDAHGREMLERLRVAVGNMSGLIDDIFKLSRATTAGLQRSKVDLSAIAESIAADIRAVAPERRAEFVIDPCVTASADPGLMRIVLENLLRNAWKYTGRQENARIEFGCRDEGGRTVFFVRDNGAGFDPKLSERLFHPFQRLHEKSEFPGTGIGLATVQRIIDRHGGRIWAESVVGEGATFYFTLEQGAAATAS
jgi:signal transduction histidine kinase